VQSKPKTVVEATSILPSLNGKTARSRRAIVPLTHLARQGRVTVTIGRRELLAALGGAAAAWPVAARGRSSRRCRWLASFSQRANDVAQLADSAAGWRIRLCRGPERSG